MTAGGQETNRMRSTLVDAGGWERWGTTGGGWEPWDTAGGIENGSSSGWAMVHDVTVEDFDVLECGICYRPLKPPIFQCTKGHVVCSPCSDRLKNAANCHVCRVVMPDDYQRCHAMEHVMDSIRVPCLHAPYGCKTRTAYHAREEHLLECPHAPCRCPDDACGFTGNVATLVKHLKAVHGWPFTAEVRACESFGVDLRNGFNFLTAIHGSAQYLLLLNMASTPFGHAISAFWISTLAAMASSSSAPATRNTTCDLQLSYFKKNVQGEHYQRSEEMSLFRVECWCPSNGLPDPSASFRLFIPKYVGETGCNEAPVHVAANIIIHRS